MSSQCSSSPSKVNFSGRGVSKSYYALHTRLGCKHKNGESCKKDDTFVILNPVLAALPQMIPQTLVLPEGSVPLVDIERTNEILRQTLDQFWADMDDALNGNCLLYTSPSPRDRQKSRMPSSA